MSRPARRGGTNGRSQKSVDAVTFGFSVKAAREPCIRYTLHRRVVILRRQSLAVNVLICHCQSNHCLPSTIIQVHVIFVYRGGSAAEAAGYSELIFVFCVDSAKLRIFMFIG